MFSLNCFRMETIDRMQGWLEFVTVANQGSFSKAADKLGLSKSQISKQIAQLEDTFQIRLFNRTTRKVHLTDAGQIFFERTRHIFDEAETARREILNMQAEPSGELRLTVAGAFGEDYIAPFMADFLKRYPRLHIYLNFTERVVDLVSENFDLAIRVGHLHNSSLVAKHLADRKEFICASPAYLEKFGQPKRPKQLLDHNCLSTNSEPWTFEGKGGLHRVKVKGNWRSNNGHANLEATLAGVGVGRLPGVYVNSHIKSGALIPLLEEYNQKATTIWLVYPHRRNLSTKVRIFVDALCEHFDRRHSETIF